jgi:hypothetical protein
VTGGYIRLLTLGFRFGADPGGKAIDREPVTVDAEAAKRCEGGTRGEGMVTEILAGVNIADVHFDGGDLHRHQRVMQRDRGVRIAGGIDDNPGRLLGMRLVDEIDQFAFAIGLPAIGFQAELRRGLRAKFLDVTGNVAVGGGVIGNNRPKGKPLGRPGPLSNASSNS